MSTNSSGQAMQDIVREALNKLDLPFEENVSIPGVFDAFDKEHDIDFVVSERIGFSIKGLLSCSGTAHEKFVKETDYLRAVVDANVLEKVVLLILGSQCPCWDGVAYFSQRQSIPVIFDRNFSDCKGAGRGKPCSKRHEYWHNAPFPSVEYVAGLLKQLLA